MLYDALISFADFDRIIKPLLEREPLDLDDAADMMIDEEIDEIRAEREGESEEQQAVEEEQDEVKRREKEEDAKKAAQ